MILSQLHDITIIDSEIVELHEKLQSLYEQRAQLIGTKNSSSSLLSKVNDGLVNLDDIDLSL